MGCFFVSAANEHADKIVLLKDSLITSPDSVKFSIIESIADELYYDGQLSESAEKYRDARLLEENSENPDPKRIATSYSNEAFCLHEIGFYENAINLYTKSLQISLKIKDSIESATQYNNIGVAYLNMGDYDKSIDYLKEALAIDIALHDTKSMGYDYSVIGNVLSEWSKFDEAIDAFRKSLDIAITYDDSAHVSLRIAKIGETFYHIQKYDSALHYFSRSLLMEKKLKNKDRLVIRLNQMANVYHETKNYNTANKYYQQAIALVSDIQQLKTKAILYCDYAQNCFALNKNQPGEQYLLKSTVIAKSIDLNQTLINNYNNLSEYYNVTGKYKKAFAYQKAYITLKDSVFNDATQEEISKFQARFQTQEKEAVIKDLMQKQQLKDLQITNEKNRRNLAFSIAIFALIALASAVFVGQKLRSKNKELNTLNSTLKRMFSIISHDLRGAISSYQSSGRILKHYLKNNKAELLPELADEISKNSQQLSTMLDNLLTWSLSQIKNQKFEPEHVDIYDVIQNEYKIYSPIAQRKNTNIINNIKEKTEVYADSQHLRLIFRNLISNAIKFTENGIIELNSFKKNHYLNISVKDSGTGIDPEMANDLYGINEKKIKRGTRNEKGTGLGLSLVKEYLKINNGSIDFESIPGKGTNFIVKIPILETYGS